MKKIGEIKGVPVVEGNVNEVTKNQIHYKEEEGGIQLSKRSNDNKLNSITSGSSEGGGEGSNIEYFAYNSNSIPILVMAGVSQLLKARIQVQSQDNIIQVIVAGPNMYVFEKLQTTDPEILAIGVDLNTKFTVKDIDGSSEIFVLLDLLLENFTKEDIASLPRITEEEFYKID